MRLAKEAADFALSSKMVTMNWLDFQLPSSFNHYREQVNVKVTDEQGESASAEDGSVTADRDPRREK